MYYNLHVCHSHSQTATGIGCSALLYLNLIWNNNAEEMINTSVYRHFSKVIVHRRAKVCQRNIIEVLSGILRIILNDCLSGNLVKPEKRLGNIKIYNNKNSKVVEMSGNDFCKKRYFIWSSFLSCYKEELYNDGRFSILEATIWRRENRKVREILGSFKIHKDWSPWCKSVEYS